MFEWQKIDIMQVLSQHQSNMFKPKYDVNITTTSRIRSHKSFKTRTMITTIVTWLHLEIIQLFLLLLKADNMHFINCHCPKTGITSISINVTVNSLKNSDISLSGTLT